MGTGMRHRRQDHPHLPRRRRARRHPPRRDQQLDRQGAGRAALPAGPAQQEGGGPARRRLPARRTRPRRPARGRWPPSASRRTRTTRSSSPSSDGRLRAASRERVWSFCPKKEAGVRFAAPSLAVKDRFAPWRCQGDRLVVIALPDFTYAVILADRGDHIMLWTAYVVDKAYRRKQMPAEWQRSGGRDPLKG